MKIFNKKDLIAYFFTDNTSGYKTRKKHIELKFEGLLEVIEEYNIKHFKKELHFTQKLYNYLYDIKKIPTCKNCEKEIKWRNRFTEGYLNHCSRKCLYESENVKKKRKETIKEKYGVDYVLRNDDIKEKEETLWTKKL